MLTGRVLARCLQFYLWMKIIIEPAVVLMLTASLAGCGPNGLRFEWPMVEKKDEVPVTPVSQVSPVSGVADSRASVTPVSPSSPLPPTPPILDDQNRQGPVPPPPTPPTPVSPVPPPTYPPTSYPVPGPGKYGKGWSQPIPSPAPNPAPNPAPTPPPARSPESGANRDDGRDFIIRDILEMSDAFRIENGLPPLKYNRKLALAAQTYAERMGREDFFDHVSPAGDGVAERISLSGYPGEHLGENIARGYKTSTETMKAWIESPPHRANLLNPAFNEIGIGYARGVWGGTSQDCPYWVQEFGGVRSQNFQ